MEQLQRQGASGGPAGEHQGECVAIESIRQVLAGNHRCRPELCQRMT
jgi:hypothetical protein